jgi:hypothetical protein
LRRYEVSYRRWHVHRGTKRPRMLPIRSGTAARYLVRLARNRRVDVAWVPGVHARSVGPRLRLKVILSDVLGLAGR